MLRPVRVVGNDQEGRAVVAQLGDEVPERASGHGVEPGRRLVEQQLLRSADDAGDGADLTSSTLRSRPSTRPPGNSDPRTGGRVQRSVDRGAPSALGQQVLDPGHALDEVVVTQRVGQAQEPARAERLTGHDCDLDRLEDEGRELG